MYSASPWNQNQWSQELETKISGTMSQNKSFPP
jgi:hypothetical protein